MTNPPISPSPSPLGTGTVRWRRVASFYSATFALTVAATLAWTATGKTWQGPSAVVVLNVCMLIPGLVGLVLQRWVYREPMASAWGIRRPRVVWLLSGWLLAAVLMLLALGFALILPGTAFAPDLSGLASLGMSAAEIDAQRLRLASVPGGALPATLFQGLLLGPTVLSVSALGEELGWRGFLHRELAPLGGARRSAMVGLLWGLWHLPAVFQGYGYPQHPILGSVLILVLTQLLAPVYSFLRERSGSIFVPMVFHGTSGATSMVAVAFVNGGNELTVGFTGLAGLFAAAAVLAAVAIGDRKSK